ncbi:hypothetical protein IJI55_00320, partial [Candidatus Saccharibacteria bacterium]|nr:hypothetical protein [Candidatus Saccharibacteria bacterium]
DICKTMPIGQTKTLQDTRGSYNTTTPANYGIIKAKDNNCWMTDNLNLYNRQISSSDSDLPSGTSLTLPNTSNWSTIDAVFRAHRGTTFTNQVYYNWCSAIASTALCSQLGDTNFTAPNSICPKNWKLPSSNNYENLKTIYGFSTEQQLVSSELSYGYWGIWNYYTQSEYGASNMARIWTSSYGHVSLQRPYSFDYGSNLIVSYGIDSDVAIGQPIRCMAR